MRMGTLGAELDGSNRLSLQESSMDDPSEDGGVWRSAAEVQPFSLGEGSVELAWLEGLSVRHAVGDEAEMGRALGS